MMKKTALYSLIFVTLSACASFNEHKGVSIFHWERDNTGVYKFARDHSECMHVAEDWHFFPTLKEMKSWIITEEAQYNIKVDWHAEEGVWASYIPYPGAQPILVNTARTDLTYNPKNYRICMENKGYWHRNYEIPETTNLFVYKPQSANERDPLQSFSYRGGKRPTDR